MRIELLEQPRLGATSALDFLRTQLSDAAVTHLHIVVAWTRPSGLALLRTSLEAFRARAGIATLVTGLSAESASIEGLRDALDLFDEVSVAFDPTERTVHTKLYVALTPESARIAIGSQNITRGGLATNHELGVSIIVDTPHPFAEQVLDYVSTLSSDTNLVHRLDEALLARLAVSDQVTFTPAYRGAIPRKDSVFAASARAFRTDNAKSPHVRRAPLAIPDAPPARWWQRLFSRKGAAKSDA